MHSHPHQIRLNPESGILCFSSLSYENILYPHHHESCELTLITDGVHTLETEFGAATLSRGDLLLLRSNEPHARRMLEKGRYLTLAFPPKELKRIADYFDDETLNWRLTDRLPPSARLSSAETDRMIHMIERLNLFITANPARVLNELRALLADCCRHLSSPETENPKGTPWLRRLLREMNTPDNIREGISVMLRLTPYTHEYLCREFKRIIGCTPTEYVNSLRLDRAHLLIESTSMTVSDICSEVGFDSLSYFHKLFRSKYGLPPAKYRKNHFVFRPDVPVEQLPEH